MEGMRHRWFSVAGMAPWVALLLGFVSALIIAGAISRTLSRTAEDNFSATASDVLRRIQVDIQSTSDLVQATQGFYNASDVVTRSEFDHYLEGSPWLRTMPGFMTVAWMPVVPAP